MFSLSKNEVITIAALCIIASSKEPISSKELAKKLNVHSRYLERDLSKLTSSKLVVSRRGVTGGYSMVRSASNIFLSEVFAATAEESNKETTKLAKQLGLGKYVKNLESQINTMFAKISLKQAINARNSTSSKA